MQQYIVILKFKTSNPLTKEEVVNLFPEQWEQTGSASGGDSIEVIEVRQVDYERMQA